jgi:hypothetical protein
MTNPDKNLKLQIQRYRLSDSAYDYKGHLFSPCYTTVIGLATIYRTTFLIVKECS